jgi:hypothetical protein
MCRPSTRASRRAWKGLAGQEEPCLDQMSRRGGALTGDGGGRSGGRCRAHQQLAQRQAAVRRRGAPGASRPGSGLAAVE